MATRKVKFSALSNFETKFELKGYTFVLRTQDRGFYGAGRSVSLYQLDGLKREFIVSVGWLLADSQPRFDNDLIKRVTTMDEIKKEAVNYVNRLLN